MKAFISLYQDLIVQIATPYSTGTGFLLPAEGLAVTNNHIVQDNCDAIVQGKKLPRQLACVVYADPLYDLAFLAVDGIAALSPLQLGDEASLSEGDKVLSIGHPFGLDFSVNQGIISNLRREVEGVYYLQHDAGLNPGNNGGPLIGPDGAVVGINTLSIELSDNIGFALPISSFKQSLSEFKAAGVGVKARCFSCKQVVGEKELDNGAYCPHCGAALYMPSLIPPYAPTGVAETIEELLAAIGQDVPLSRRGPNHWEVQKGSARITIAYHEDTGLIMGDAYLCTLPSTGVKPIYEFLLRENFEAENLSFSVKEQDIVLSLLVFDRYLNQGTGIKLFRHLFERADYYDNLLVEEYGAQWKAKEI